MTDEIRVEKSDGPPGWVHWKFYIRGEYRGSAPTQRQARSAAKDLLEQIQAHESKQRP